MFLLFIHVFLILAVLDPKFKMFFYNNKYNNRRATVCKELHLDTFYYHYYFWILAPSALRTTHQVFSTQT